MHELRKTIEALQQQSAEAGLTKAALQSMQAVQRSKTFSCPNGGDSSRSIAQLGQLAASSTNPKSPAEASCDGQSVQVAPPGKEPPQHNKDSNKRGVVIRRHTFNHSKTATVTATNNNISLNNKNNNVKENSGGGLTNGENECAKGESKEF